MPAGAAWCVLREGMQGAWRICRRGTRLRQKACHASGCIRACSLGPLRQSMHEYRARVSTRGGSHRSCYHTDTLAYDGSVTTRSGHRVAPSCVATRMDRVRTCFPAVWVRVTTNLPAFSSNRISHLQPGCRVAYAIAPPHSTGCFRCSARKQVRKPSDDHSIRGTCEVYFSQRPLI